MLTYEVDNEGNIMGKVYMLQITTISPFFNDGNVTESSKWNIWWVITFLSRWTTRGTSWGRSTCCKLRRFRRFLWRKCYWIIQTEHMMVDDINDILSRWTTSTTTWVSSTSPCSPTTICCSSFTTYQKCYFLMLESLLANLRTPLLTFISNFKGIMNAHI